MKKQIDRVLAKMGIMLAVIKSNPEFVKSVKSTAGIHHIDVTFYVGTKNSGVAVFIGPKLARKIKSLQRKINTFKSHFDNEYTVREWRAGEKGRFTVVKQLFRKVTENDYDSQEEFALVWTSLSKDMLNDYIDGCLPHGCCCSYDCCGHWFATLWSHKTKKFGPFALIYIGHGRNV